MALLKLKYDKPLANFAFKFNLRRYSMVTSEGRIKIKLRPDWHVDSVTYVSRLAAEKACTKSCHLYRPEPTFLLQGTLKSFSVAANKNTLKAGLASPCIATPHLTSPDLASPRLAWPRLTPPPAAAQPPEPSPNRTCACVNPRLKPPESSYLV